MDCPFPTTNAPLPPKADRRFGYPGNARFVGFYWEPAGDEAAYDDGRLTGTGNSTLLLAYRTHPAVCRHLGAYRLGNSETQSEDWLILDRESGTLRVAPREEAGGFLASQQPTGPWTEIDPSISVLDQGDPFDIDTWEEVPVDASQVIRLLEADRRDLAEMLAFLDRSRPDDSPPVTNRPRPAG